MSNDIIQPDTSECRSFVYRKFNNLPVTWDEINGYAVAYTIHDLESELAYAQHLALSDISHIARIGFKGFGTAEWLSNQNINIPADVNTAETSSDGCLIAKLGTNDILVVDDLLNSSNLPSKLQQQWQQDYSTNPSACGFIMPRQDSHACFCISGINAPEMFSTLCAIDLRPNKFNNHMIAQTSLARTGAIIIRCDIGDVLNFLVFVESVSAEYCWECLYDAMQDSSGQIIGLSTLVTLSK